MRSLKYGYLYTDKCKNFKFTYEYFEEYSVTLKANGIYFRIYEENDGIDPMYHFEYALRVMENNTDLKVVDLFAKKYIGLGISRAIILKSKEIFQKRIISSSNKFPSYIGEANWPESIDKVWKPLVSRGLANYDIKNDYYFVL